LPKILSLGILVRLCRLRARRASTRLSGSTGLAEVSPKSGYPRCTVGIIKFVVLERIV
jgi:hypothetical protein